MSLVKYKQIQHKNKLNTKTPLKSDKYVTPSEE